jgi:phage terminase small subunit
MKAYNQPNYHASAVNASRKLKNADFNKRFRDKLEEIRQKPILSFEERQKILSEVAINGRNAEKIKSIDVLNKMSGDYIEKVQADTNITVQLDASVDEWAN